MIMVVVSEHDTEASETRNSNLCI